MATRQDVDSPLLMTIGAIGALLVLTIVVGIQAWYTSELDDETVRKADAAPNVWLNDLHGAQEANLNKERWIDRDKKIVQIPIDRAMQLIAENKGMLPTTQPAAATKQPASRDGGSSDAAANGSAVITTGSAAAAY